MISPNNSFDGKQFLGKLLITLRESGEYNLYTRITTCKGAKLSGNKIVLEFDNDSAVEYIKTKLDDLTKLMGKTIGVVKVDKYVDPAELLAKKLINTFGKKVIIK